MEKGINAAIKILSDTGKNWLSYLEEYSLNLIFKPIYKLDLSITDSNLFVCFIIYAYDSESKKIDINKDRIENKLQIAKSIGLDIKNKIVYQAIHNNNTEVNDVILEYLKEMTDWRWQTVFALLDHHSSMIRFVNKKSEIEKRTETVDDKGGTTTIEEEFQLSELSKINKQKGDLLQQAIAARKQADEIIMQIKRDFVSTDYATNNDLGFEFSDTSKKKIDILSWREFIKNKNKHQLA